MFQIPDFSGMVQPLCALLPLLGLAFGRKKKEAKEGDEAVELTEAAHALIESTFDGVIVTDTEGEIKRSDEDFTRLMGFEAEDLDGRAFASLVDPTEAEHVQRYLTQAAESAQDFEVRTIDNSGSVRTLRVTAVPFLHGRELELVVGVTDISAEDSLRRRLIFTEKIDLLSGLMTNIGSDISRAVEVIGPLVKKSANAAASEALERLSDLQERISFFPIRGIRGAGEMSVSDLIDDAIQQATAGTSVRIEHLKPFGDGIIPPVLAEGDQLVEALRQTMRNAIEAVAVSGGTVKVETSLEQVARAIPRRDFILPPGDYVHIAVKDTGPGIPAAMLGFVFDPLFTTRGGRPLAGLGLAVAYGIIKNHRGFIDMESTQGSGTTVDIYLPRSRLSEIRIEEGLPLAAIDEDEEAPAPTPTYEPEPIEETAAPDAGTAMTAQDLLAEAEAEMADRGEFVANETGGDKAPRDVEPAPVKTVDPEVPEEVPLEDTVASAQTADAPVDPEPVKEEEVAAEALIEAAEEAEAEAVDEADAAEVVPEIAPFEDAAVTDMDHTIIPGVADEPIPEEEMATLSGHETILIIEEETDSRTQITDALESFGYNALPARNWIEGVNLFKGHAQLIDLVLVNILVPEMVWVKTVIDLQRTMDRVRIGMMGGREFTPTIKHYLEMDGISMLKKPFTTASLLREVRAALDEPAKEKTAEEGQAE
jgi:PAS domain S-box-containing protein